MPKHHLDDLLKSLAAKPVPSPPKNLEMSVWREIRLRRDRPRHSWLDDLAALIWARHVAWASVTVTILMGISVGVVWGGLKAAAAQPLAARALSLDVFSESAPTLPSTILGRKP